MKKLSNRENKIDSGDEGIAENLSETATDKPCSCDKAILADTLDNGSPTSESILKTSPEATSEASLEASLEATSETSPEATPEPPPEMTSKTTQETLSPESLEHKSARNESVAKSTLKMSMSTLLSRITGFIRTWACAFAIGNTLLASAYQVANNVPNMIYELVAGGILTTAFLPVYVAQLNKRKIEGAGQFASSLLWLGAIFLAIVSLLATVFAPQVIWTQTFMSGGEDAQTATFFFRFFAIQVVFYGVGAIISGILNGHKEFLWPAIGPVFNNIVVIITMFSYVPLSSVSPEGAKICLAIGTSLGVLVQFAVQIPALCRLKIPIRLKIDIHDPALKETLRLALPATVFVIVNIIVVSFRNAFSLGVADNGPSTLSYAWLWYQFPYGVIAVALSTAMLTEMSESAALERWDIFKENVRNGISGTMFLIIPLATLIFVLALPLIGLYHAGEFTSDDVQLVATVLKAWAVSLPFYAGYMYVYRAFSAMQDLGLVTKVDAVGRIFQAGMYALFSHFFGLIGIPLSDAVYYIVMFFVLCLLLKKRVGTYGLALALKTTVLSAVASFIAGGISYVLYYFFGNFSNILMSFITIVWIGIVGLAIYLVMAKLFKIPETKLFTSLARKFIGKFKKA